MTRRSSPSSIFIRIHPYSQAPYSVSVLLLPVVSYSDTRTFNKLAARCPVKWPVYRAISIQSLSSARSFPLSLSFFLSLSLFVSPSLCLSVSFLLSDLDFLERADIPELGFSRDTCSSANITFRNAVTPAISLFDRQVVAVVGHRRLQRGRVSFNVRECIRVVKVKRRLIVGASHVTL